MAKKARKGTVQPPLAKAAEIEIEAAPAAEVTPEIEIEAAPAAEVTPEIEAAPAAEVTPEIEAAVAVAVSVPATLADKLETTAIELLGLTAEGLTHTTKNKGLDAAADGLGGIAAEIRKLHVDHDKAVELLTVAVEKAEAADAAAKAAGKELTKARAEVEELTAANAEFAGIEEELAATKAEVTAVAEAARKTAENDVKLARKARDDAKKAAREAAAERDDTLARMANIKADLNRVGVETADDLVRMAEAAKGLDSGKSADLKLRAEVAEAKEELRAAQDELIRIEETQIADAAEQKQKLVAMTEELVAMTEERDALLASVPAPPADDQDDDDDDDGSNIKPEAFATTEPKNIGEAIAVAMGKAIAAGIEPEVLMEMLPRLQAAILNVARKVATPLLDAGLVIGTFPTSLAEFELMTEAPLSPATGADMSEAFRVGAEALVAALTAGDTAGDTAGGVLEDGEGAAESRRRLNAAFGEALEVGGAKVWGIKVPTLIGYALRQRGDKMVALGHQVTMWQPFTVVVKGDDGTTAYTVNRVIGTEGQIKLVRPDARAGEDGLSTVLLGGDAIVRVHRAPAISANGLNAAQAAEALASAKGFRPGFGTMALPRGIKTPVDINGRALPGCPLVNLDEIAAALYAEAAEAAC